MKHTLLAIALCTACTGYAVAQDEEVLAPVIVEHVDGYRIVENCTPPASAPECAGFHELIRQYFSDREIGMLFGAATAYPEYRTSYDSVRERYDNLVRYVEDNGVPAVAAAYYEPVQPPVAAYQGQPIRDDVIVDDADAAWVDDDPDAVVLRRTTTTGDGRY
ncbi:MAG TPA: hypothetical protein VGH81_02025 [Rudaea sp.]|jgi:hypothetical protein